MTARQPSVTAGSHSRAMYESGRVPDSDTAGVTKKHCTVRRTNSRPYTGRMPLPRRAGTPQLVELKLLASDLVLTSFRRATQKCFFLLVIASKQTISLRKRLSSASSSSFSTEIEAGHPSARAGGRETAMRKPATSARLPPRSGSENWRARRGSGRPTQRFAAEPGRGGRAVVRVAAVAAVRVTAGCGVRRLGGLGHGPGHHFARRSPSPSESVRLGILLVRV